MNALMEEVVLGGKGVGESRKSRNKEWVLSKGGTANATRDFLAASRYYKARKL